VFEIALSFRAQKTEEVYDMAEMWDLRGWEQTPPHPCAMCDAGHGAGTSAIAICHCHHPGSAQEEDVLERLHFR